MEEDTSKTPKRNIRTSTFQEIGHGTPTSMRIKNFVDPLTPFLEYQGFVVLDGGLATELERKGANLKDTLWSAKCLVENPELIQEVHEDYIRAGADIITSSSYQASFGGFEQRGLNENEAKKLFELSVKLAQQAVENVWATMKDTLGPGGVSMSTTHKRLKPLVAASLGPYGSYQGSEFVGNYGKTVKELVDFYHPRIKAVLAADPDILLIETVPCGNEEAKALQYLLESEFCNVPTIISFSCANGDRCNCGEPFEDAVKIASDIPNVIGVGANCTSPLYMSDLLRHAKKVTEKSLVVYPNRGELYDTSAQEWKGSAIDFKVEEWYQHGAKVFGGCCRTTPSDITSIRETLLNLRK